MISVAKENTVRVKISRVLYKNILKIQISDDMTFEQASEKVGSLFDSRSNEFDRLVEKRVTGEMKRKFMKQLNIARSSIYQRDYEGRFTYECTRCDAPIAINGESLEAAQNFLHKKWGHSRCIDS